MPVKKIISHPFFSFTFDEILELQLKNYINLRKDQEIAGGLVGDIIGGKKNNIIFEINKFLPFPNLSEDPLHFATPPEAWFKILEEWRVFYYSQYKFLGFLHTHPESSSKLSEQDKKFGHYLHAKYGSIVFIIIGKNKYLRCYCFNDSRRQIIGGKLNLYNLISY